MDSPTSPAAAAAVVAKVLDDDDLLREILLRVGFPTTLVRAALVCTRWYHHAADRAFLRRFRQRHPPRLLGLYVEDAFFPETPEFLPHFVPMLTQTEEPELATVLRRRATLSLDAADVLFIRDCQNGSVFVSRFRNHKCTYEVHNPLFPERGMVVLPTPPPPPATAGGRHISTFTCILPRGGDACLSYMWLVMETSIIDGGTTGKVYMLQDGVWVMLAKATTQLPHPIGWPKPLLINDRIYMAGGTSKDLLVLNLANSSFFTIQLPEGVEWPSRYIFGIKSDNRDAVLSWADDSGVYLIDLKELRLRIWLHKDGNWLLVDTICLREICAALGMSDGMVEDEHTTAVRMSGVGDNAEFVFLQMGRCTLYLDIRRRVLRKVYELRDQYVGQIHPFMMIWPPAFPALKDDSTRSVFGLWVITALV